MERKRRLYRTLGEIGIWTVVFLFVVYLNFFESLTPCEISHRMYFIGGGVYVLITGLIIGLNFLEF
jgi:hypothetical protein